MRILTVIFFCLFFYYLMKDTGTSEPQPVNQFVSPSPEPGRAVDHFDWQKYQYVYKDEVLVDTVNWVKPGPLPYYPDYAVEIINSPQPSQSYQGGKYFVKGNTRYKAIYKANGDIQLVKVR